MYLLREIEFDGALLNNPYLASVGLTGTVLEDRLRALDALAFERQGDLIHYGWRYPDLAAWAADRLGTANEMAYEAGVQP